MQAPLERARRWLTRAENLTFLLLCAGALVPVWTASTFPSQDGPSHVETAYILLHYGDADHPIYRRFYELDLGVGPNWLTSLVLAALMTFAPPAVAEKLFVSGYILTFAGSMRFAVGAIAAENRWLATLALLLVYNLPLHMGFYNFCFSVALCPLLVGIFARHHPIWPLRGVVAYALAAVVLFLWHPISLVMAAVAIACLAAWPWRGLRATLAPLVGLLPAAGLVLLFMTSKEAASGDPVAFRMRLQDLWFLQSFDPIEKQLCVAVFALFAVLIVGRALLRDRRGDGGGWHALLLAAAADVAIYAMSPDRMGGGSIIKLRLTLYPFLMLLLWLAAGRYPRWLRLGVQGLAVAILGLQLAFYTARYRMIDERLAEYMSAAPHITPGSTVLPLTFDSWGATDDGKPLSIRIQPFYHLAGHLAAARGALNLLNYQGTMGYFAVHFRDELNPFHHITEHDKDYHRAPPMDFATYPQRTGGTLDYVLLWGLRSQHLGTEGVKAILSQLRSGYHEVFSSQGGRLKLFRRNL